MRKACGQLMVAQKPDLTVQRGPAHAGRVFEPLRVAQQSWQLPVPGFPCCWLLPRFCMSWWMVEHHGPSAALWPPVPSRARLPKQWPTRGGHYVVYPGDPTTERMRSRGLIRPRAAGWLSGVQSVARQSTLADGDSTQFSWRYWVYQCKSNCWN